MSIVAYPASTDDTNLDSVGDASISNAGNAIDGDDSTYCDIVGSEFGTGTTPVYLSVYDVPPIDKDRREITAVSISVISEYAPVPQGGSTEIPLASIGIPGIATLRSSNAAWTKRTDTFSVSISQFFDIVNWEVRCSISGTLSAIYEIADLKIYLVYITYTYADADPLPADNNYEHISQDVTEVVEGGIDRIRISQDISEILEGGLDRIRISQDLTEVLLRLSTGALRVFVVG
jgi:hypothetical protein